MLFSPPFLYPILLAQVEGEEPEGRTLPAEGSAMEGNGEKFPEREVPNAKDGH